MAARKHGVGWIAITISALSLAIACEDTGQMTGTALPGPTAGMAAGAGGAIAAGGTAAPAPGGATGGAGVTPVPTGGTGAPQGGASGSVAPTGGTGGGGEPGPDASTVDPDAGSPDAGPAVPRWQDREDLGMGDGSDVVTIGDSWMDYILGGGGIEGALDRAGTDYRHYSVSGTQLLNGQIPGQYDRAKSANPEISTVIMTGGGNDIMFDSGSCSTPERCTQKVNEIVAGLNELWTEMSNDGVKDVVMIRYSADAGTTPSENRPTMVDVAQICVTGPIICHSLETTDLVMGSLVDGIHPTSTANDRIAAALIPMMAERKMRR
jgi:hypothetical protein